MKTDQTKSLELSKFWWYFFVGVSLCFEELDQLVSFATMKRLKITFAIKLFLPYGNFIVWLMFFYLKRCFDFKICRFLGLWWIMRFWNLWSHCRHYCTSEKSAFDQFFKTLGGIKIKFGKSYCNLVLCNLLIFSRWGHYIRLSQCLPSRE